MNLLQPYLSEEQAMLLVRAAEDATVLDPHEDEVLKQAISVLYHNLQKVGIRELERTLENDN